MSTTAYAHLLDLVAGERAHCDRQAERHRDAYRWGQTALIVLSAAASLTAGLGLLVGPTQSPLLQFAVLCLTTVGTALGALTGVLLAQNLPQVLGWIEAALNATLSPGDVYMISYLRAELQVEDVVLTCVSALVVSFLATLYPAYRATRIQPAEVLRYE